MAVSWEQGVCSVEPLDLSFAEVRDKSDLLTGEVLSHWMGEKIL
jgi:hypothetical protein